MENKRQKPLSVLVHLPVPPAPAPARAGGLVMRKLRFGFYSICFLSLVALSLGTTKTLARPPRAEHEAEMKVLQKVRAPELTGGRSWLNTDKPLSLAQLRGKIVLLDFWTYGCINCMHIIPDLQKLEEKYARQLVVIGVHSAKFENEKETENIRRVILRYQIEHPVVNDADFRIWRSYAINAWPTQILIDPAGYVVGQARGEGNYEVIDEAIAGLIAEFRKRGELNEQPLKLALERAKVGDLPLAFPGKILADAKSDRLFVTDSNHNRIVITRLDGTLIDTIGSGSSGASDGAIDRATFHRPQGLALDGDTLYVADTVNHLIRRVDLKNRLVETIAGTGRQTREHPPSGGPARTTSISSPWDLQLAGQTLYIAMAGPHQIWKLDLKTNQLAIFAGSAREARTDGPLTEAAFAQPSGLTTDGAKLFVADSESNIIRSIDLNDSESPKKSDAKVRTLAGGDLFEFGDQDGRGDDVRLQHPLGVLFYDGRVFVADTYNHKIKTLDPERRVVKTFLGTGKPGQVDGASPTFYEPGGLTVAFDKLYIADTNNHAVRVVDLKTRQTTTLMMKGLLPPKIAADAQPDTDTNETDEKEITLSPQRIRSGDANIIVDVKLPSGEHLNPSAPHRYKIVVEEGSEHIALDAKAASRTSTDLKLPLSLSLKGLSPGSSRLRVQLTIYYCREDNTGTCRIKTLMWRVPVEVSSDPVESNEIIIKAEIR
jgi:DNA-binding beta-propeller fold protein YncE